MVDWFVHSIVLVAYLGVGDVHEGSIGLQGLPVRVFVPRFDTFIVDTGYLMGATVSFGRRSEYKLIDGLCFVYWDNVAVSGVLQLFGQEYVPPDTLAVGDIRYVRHCKRRVCLHTKPTTFQYSIFSA